MDVAFAIGCWGEEGDEDVKEEAGEDRILELGMLSEEEAKRLSRINLSPALINSDVFWTFGFDILSLDIADSNERTSFQLETTVTVSFRNKKGK